MSNLDPRIFQSDFFFCHIDLSLSTFFQRMCIIYRFTPRKQSCKKKTNGFVGMILYNIYTSRCVGEKVARWAWLMIRFLHERSLKYWTFDIGVLGFWKGLRMILVGYLEIFDVNKYWFSVRKCFYEKFWWEIAYGLVKNSSLNGK